MTGNIEKLNDGGIAFYRCGVKALIHVCCP